MEGDGLVMAGVNIINPLLPTQGRITRLNPDAFNAHHEHVAFIKLGTPCLGDGTSMPDTAHAVQATIDALHARQLLPMGWVSSHDGHRHYQQPWMSTVEALGGTDPLIGGTQALISKMLQHASINRVHPAANGSGTRINIYPVGGWFDAHRHGPGGSFMLEGGTGHSGQVADKARNAYTLHVTICWQGKDARHLILEVRLLTCLLVFCCTHIHQQTYAKSTNKVTLLRNSMMTTHDGDDSDEDADEADDEPLQYDGLRRSAHARLALSDGGVVHVMTRAAVGNFFHRQEVMQHGLTEGGEVFAQPSVSVILQVC